MRYRFRLPLLALAATLSFPALAASPKPTDAKGDKADIAKAHQQDKEDAAEAGWIKPPVDEQAVATHHIAQTQAGAIKYTATAGTLTIRDDDAKPIASVFYVAYTADGVKDYAHRPVTFFYNGGPGSSTLWLHMGSFAPDRVQTANPEYIRPAPYAFGANHDTLLDKSDLVFVDAIGTGYSRALGDKKDKDFWGVDQDADGFARAIMRYVTRNARWQSPKFIFGESYGTTRSGVLSNMLQERGMALNGVIILSSILNYGVRQPGFDNVYVSYLPSYAATAWYHHKVPNPPADVATFVQQAREFAAGPYSAALAQGSALDPATRDRIAQQLSGFTGLSVSYLLAANLRVDLGRFEKELLRDQRLTTGRYDSRYTGIDADAAGERPEYDASDTAISGAFIASFQDYMQRDLHYKTDMPYRVSAYGLDGFKWDFQHKAPGNSGGRGPQTTPDVAIDISAAMRTNPYLHLLSLNGYYDMATPFFGTEYDLKHMGLDPAQSKNVEFRYYPSGHMAYLNPDALHMLHRDLAAFYDETVRSAETGRPHGKPMLSGGGAGGPS